MSPTGAWEAPHLLFASTTVLASSGLASWGLITLEGGLGWAVATAVASTYAVLATAVKRFASRRARLLPLAMTVLGTSLLSLSFGLSVLAIIGFDGASLFSIGWNHPERAAWPQMALGLSLLVVGVPMARQVEWIRSLQSREEPVGPLRPDRARVSRRRWPTSRP
jgi:hypothetical protein